MPKEFKYDTEQFISLVQERPCLWNKSLEIYKDRVERKRAWDEIFNILEDNYQDMNAEEKRFVASQVLSKWTNLRDAFHKSLKPKIGGFKRKYVLYENMKFLLSNKQDTEYEDPLNYQDMEIPRPKKKPKIEVAVEEIQESSRDSEDQDQSQNELFSHYENDPRVMNEDEAFFASLLPTVVQYNIEDRLEFRMEVLAVMKKINDKKKY